jgi:phage gp29-like protein
MATKQPKKPEIQEIATVQRDINRFTYGGVLQNLDDTLLTRGRGKGLKIYDELERDAHCFAVLQKRKLAVVARQWQVDARSESAPDQAAADLVKRQLDELGKVIEDESQLITGFDQMTANLLDATLKGYAVGEVMWEVRGAEVWAARVIPRDQRRFAFDEQSKLRMLTRSDLLIGELLPPRKFVVHRYGAKDESPYGKGLGHVLFWPVFFKRQDIGFWLVFADKFGSPTAIGKYPPGAKKEEQKKLLDALGAIAQDAGVIVPEGMLIELLEAARTGSIDTYEKLARYMDEQISEAVLGETMSTTAQGAGLGSGQATVQNEVRVEIARADGDMLSDTLNATLVRWIVDYNLPGAGYPKVWRNFDEGEDLEKRSRVDKALHDMGYEPEDAEYVNETYGGRWVKRAPRPPSPFGFPPEFAEGGAAARAAIAAQEDLRNAAEKLASGWREQLGPRIRQLTDELERSGDLVAFKESLTRLAGEEPPAELIEALDRATFSAYLAGRAQQ